MLYLIGLGLNKDSISLEGMEALKECEQVYLESYTVDFPYTVETLEKSLKKKIIILDRTKVESEDLIKESKKKNLALLVYGCPLFATTHMSLISDAKSAKIKTKIIYATSVFDAIAESGLQLYKFGKITSMPTWQKSYEPYSFLEAVQENQSIQAHSLILIDIGLEFNDALIQLEQAINKPEIKVKINKLLVCSRLGTENAKFFYDTANKLKTKKVSKPFCFIIPEKMHFLEEEIVESF